MKQQILTEDKIRKILRRIATQVYETNAYEPSVSLVGVVGEGYEMTKVIKRELKKIDTDFKVNLFKLAINKEDPLKDEIKLNGNPEELKIQPVVLIDDVLKTGKTLAYGLKYLLATGVKSIEIAVLVNRSHSLFPISATYSGYELSTTIDEHIEVVMGKQPGAFIY